MPSRQSAADKYPDRYQKLIETADKVFDDPDYKAAVVATKAPWEFIQRGDAEACKKYVSWITELGAEYKSLLTGAS